MSQPARYEIEIRGRATDRVLHPVVDDFQIEPTDVGTTRLTGEVRDASHLNGVLAHLTSMNVEVVALRRIDPHPADPPGTVLTNQSNNQTTNQHTSPEKGTSS